MKKIAILALTLVLSACGNKGPEFEGQWLDTRNGTSLLDIKKNGDEFVIRSSNPKVRGGSPGAPVPAVAKDGKLVLENALGQPTFSYIAESDTLVFASVAGNEEYRRVKK